MFQKRNVTTWIGRIVLVILISGCDDRATQIAREAANRQAQQNTAMADLNKEVASGTHQLVEADAQARKEIVGVHHELQAERTRLDTGWNSLEQERRQIAGQRRTESMLVPVIQAGGLLASNRAAWVSAGTRLRPAATVTTPMPSSMNSWFANFFPTNRRDCCPAMPGPLLDQPRSENHASE